MRAELKSKIQNPKSGIVLLLICLLAFALRLGPLCDNRFHPDEALFSTWAMKIARGENFLLSGVPVDKPPLLIYLSALSFFVFGQSELAARVPNLIASVISVPLLYQLARRAYCVSASAPGYHSERSEESRPVVRDASSLDSAPQHDRVKRIPFHTSLALLAALLLALSPFAILFAPTAFLDPTMVMFGLASLVAASRGRAGWTGILLGLSFAAKVQGVFFLPLAVLFAWPVARMNSRADKANTLKRVAGRFLLGLGGVILIVFVWDRARGGLPFWVQQAIHYGDIRVIYAGEFKPRLAGWLNFLPYFFGPIAGMLGLIGLPFLLRRDFTRDARSRSARIDLWLLAYTIGFLVFHWLLNFPVWDRYLLILVPIVALLFGRSLHLVTLSPRHLVSPSLLLSIIALVILPFSAAAAESRYPLGGDHGASDGIDQVAHYLKSLPSGTVVYEHWLAWQLGYYMGDGFAYLSYFDTPTAIADDLRVFAGHDHRYVIFSAREAPDKVIDAIEQVGYTLTPVFTVQDRFRQTSFTVYQIVKRKT